jgi:hypothetical protein
VGKAAKFLKKVDFLKFKEKGMTYTIVVVVFFLGGMLFTPIVVVILTQLLGGYANDQDN